VTTSIKAKIKTSTKLQLALCVYEKSPSFAHRTRMHR